MKKIIFMCINMNVGGTEKALLNLINEIDRNKYEITLLMLEEYGGFLNQIPKDIKIKYLYEYKDFKSYVKDPPQKIAIDLMKNRELFKGFAILSAYTVTKLFNNMAYYYKYILRKIKTLNEEYDIAVAYAGPMDLITYFIINKIQAKKKIQWIHLDVTKDNFNISFARKIYKKFDKIFVVSRECREKIINLIPSLDNKTDVFFNIIPCNKIKEMSLHGGGEELKFEGIKIVTVGRISKEKGQDLIIPAIAKLKKNGHNIRWFCIGDGPLVETCRNLSRYLDVENECLFLGTKLNPYPYMKECDIYIQPSRYECYCTTISEAKIFNKPIISTNVNGAQELIINEETGIIVDIDENAIYQALERLCIDDKLRKRLSENLRKYKKDNRNEMSKLYEL